MEFITYKISRFIYNKSKKGGEQMPLEPLIKPYEVVFGIIGIIIGITIGMYITFNFINVV